MKLLGLLAAGALQLPLVGALAMRASLGLKETLLAANRERSVSFTALPFDVPNNTLTATYANDNELEPGIRGPDSRILCTDSYAIEDNGEVAVVLAFSKCLNDTALGIAEQWVNEVKATFSSIANDANVVITFQSTMVPGACEARSEKTKRGVEDPAMGNQAGAPHAVSGPALLAEEVLPSDLKRLEAFPALGNVVNLADDGVTLAVNPIAVISFVTGEKSYGEVMQFKASAHVSTMFNFQICNGGTNCDGTFENCIYLEEMVDLFMYNPFTVTRSLQCENLDNGIPVTYLDEYGERQCYCNCPAGYVLETNEYGDPACKQVVEDVCPCVWSQVNEFKYKVTADEAQCSFKSFATNGLLSVPFPTDGYVADKRDTRSDGFMAPRITVTAERVQDPEYSGSQIRDAVGTAISLPLTFAEVVSLHSEASSYNPLVAAGYDTSIHDREYTWKDYQLNRVAHIDDIEFNAYGKYHLDMSAYDYFSSATCAGCFVIVDDNRPTATTECPKSFCDDIADPVHCTESAELTAANLEKANALAG
ncbi:hypothetical protein PHYPSEUDO_002100, partial [Phytophthora pseudosyringae]